MSGTRAKDAAKDDGDGPSTRFADDQLKTIVRLRKMDPDERREQEAVLETYMLALGMLPGGVGEAPEVMKPRSSSPARVSACTAAPRGMARRSVSNAGEGAPRPRTRAASRPQAGRGGAPPIRPP